MVSCEAISRLAQVPANRIATSGGFARTNGRLHLPEEMDVAAAHRQHIVASLQVNLRRFIVMTLHVADRTQIHNNRSMDLRELLRIELLEQVLDRRPNHRLGWLASVPPCDKRVLLVRAKVVHIIDRDEAQGLSRLCPNPAQRLALPAALQLRELGAELLL